MSHFLKKKYIYKIIITYTYYAQYNSVDLFGFECKHIIFILNLTSGLYAYIHFRKDSLHCQTMWDCSCSRKKNHWRSNCTHTKHVYYRFNNAFRYVV